MHVHRSARFAAAVAATIIAVCAVGTATASADDEAVFRKLYREDAGAEFVIHHGGCVAERTIVSTGFHHHSFRENGVRHPREVVFGVTIQEFDCQEQLVAVYQGNEGTPRPFDVQPGLTSAWVDTTIEACQAFPSAGDCFPVHLRLGFTGVGETQLTVVRDDINDPDCVIHYLDRVSTRAARAFGSIAFAPPSTPARSFHVTAADLSRTGATLSKEFERSFMRGDGFNCTER